MEQQVEYCTSADGVSIGYAREGGTRGALLLFVTSWNTPMQLVGTAIQPVSIIAAIANGNRAVRYDRRGIGHSQRDVEDVSLAAQVADTEAVASAIGEERFDLLAFGDGAYVAAIYAARHPERVRKLVIDPPPGMGRVSMWQSLADMVRTNWGLGQRAIADITIQDDLPEARRAFIEALPRFVSADVAARYLEEHTRWAFGDDLKLIACPTLVIAIPGRSTSTARRMAASIPGARLMVAPFSNWDKRYGEMVWPFLFDEERGADAELLAAKGTAIILFADIVDSTSLTEQLGDAAFRARARSLDDQLRKLILAHDGQAIDGKLLGDGVLAVFTSAQDGIAAAVECTTASTEVGLQMHLGLHAGDIIRERDNIYGGAVNIAARIASMSAPNELLVSDVIRSLGLTSAGVTFHDRGEQILKGVSEPVRVYEVRRRPT